MLKKILSLSILMLIGSSAFSQQAVTIRELNTYQNGLTYLSEIPDHPLDGVDVTFGAVISSYPKNSGLSTPRDNGDEPVTVSRIHVFVTDTSAVAGGRDGMSIQIVESNVALIEGANRGDVVRIRGDLGFFGSVAQFDVTELEILGNVNDEDFARYKPLIAPVVLPSADVLNKPSEQDPDQFTARLDNYSKYSGSYVKFEDAVIVNVVRNDTGRPNWAIKKGNALVYLYDVSLRYRNDRSFYRAGYNLRQGEDGAFIPPNPGSRVDVSGYLALQGFSPNGDIDSLIYQIVPMDDGVLWSEDQNSGEMLRFVNGVDGFEWPVDLAVTTAAPFVSDISLSNALPTSTTDVTLTASIEAGTVGASIDSAVVVYNGGAGNVRGRMTASGSEWTFTFPRFADATSVSYQVIAYETNGTEILEGNSDQRSYLINDTPISTIYQLQYPGQEGAGASQFAEIGDPFSVNIEATVVSGGDDGVVVIHQADTAYAGIIVQATDNVEAWVRGDVVTITRIQVEEVFDVTSIIVLDGSVTGSMTEEETDALVPALVTEDLGSATEDEHEPWEGMLVEVQDVFVLAQQADFPSDFGEFEIGSEGTEVGSGLRINDDLNRDFTFFTIISSSFNEHVKVGASADWIQGVYYYSFGNAKITAVYADSDDFTYPERDIQLFEPVREDGFFVAWTPSEDYDENEVTYEFALTTPDDEDFASPLLRSASDNDGVDTTMSFTEEEIETLLADQGLEVGASADLIWTVFVSDGFDTLQVASYDRNNIGSDDFPDGWTPFYAEVSATYLSVEGGDLPKAFALDQNFPNPFNPTTRISYALPAASEVRLQVFDLLGRNVATLVNTQMPAGRHAVDFDAAKLASGIYIYRLQAGNKTFAKRMTLVK